MTEQSRGARRRDDGFVVFDLETISDRAPRRSRDHRDRGMQGQAGVIVERWSALVHPTGRPTFAREHAYKLRFRLVRDLAADGVPVAVACRVLHVSKARPKQGFGPPHGHRSSAGRLERGRARESIGLQLGTTNAATSTTRRTSSSQARQTELGLDIPSKQRPTVDVGHHPSHHREPPRARRGRAGRVAREERARYQGTPLHSARDGETSLAPRRHNVAIRSRACRGDRAPRWSFGNHRAPRAHPRGHTFGHAARLL